MKPIVRDPIDDDRILVESGAEMTFVPHEHSEFEKLKHQFIHIPFQPWCTSCVKEPHKRTERIIEDSELPVRGACSPWAEGGVVRREGDEGCPVAFLDQDVGQLWSENFRFKNGSMRSGRATPWCGPGSLKLSFSWVSSESMYSQCLSW